MQEIQVYKNLTDFAHNLYLLKYYEITDHEYIYTRVFHNFVLNRTFNFPKELKEKNILLLLELFNSIKDISYCNKILNEVSYACCSGRMND